MNQAGLPLPEPPQDKAGLPNVKGGEIHEPGVYSQGQELRLESERNEHKRSQTFKDTVLIGTNAVVSVIAVMIAIGVFIFALHHFLPLECRWLPPEEIKSLQDLLLTALLGGLFFENAKRLLLKD